jgi:glyoxylase-like metal-dependent hydrolase (beta-lactamase superfamily II)
MRTMAACDDGLTMIRLETLTSRAFDQGAWVYLLDGVLVDSGFVYARAALLRALAGQQIDTVVNTHTHEDHAGNNAAVSEAFGAAILAPGSTLHLLEDPARLHMKFYEFLIWGRPKPCTSARPLGARVATRRGRLEVVPTPGHSPDHVAFFEPERRWLFTGDLFLGPRVRDARPFENAADLVASLRRVLELRPLRLFCTHRGPIDDATSALQAKLHFVEEVRSRAIALHRTGMSRRGIASRTVGPESTRQWLLTGGDYSRVHFVDACLRPPSSGYQQPGSVEY